jgi:hypothetical protein
MVKKASDLDFDALAALAKAATDEVWATTTRPLPVWSGGRVVLELPPPKGRLRKEVADVPPPTIGAIRKRKGVAVPKSGRSGKHVRRNSND